MRQHDLKSYTGNECWFFSFKVNHFHCSHVDPHVDLPGDQSFFEQFLLTCIPRLPTWEHDQELVLLEIHSYLNVKSPDHFDFPAKAACLSANTLSKNLQKFICFPKVALNKDSAVEYLFSLLAWSPKSLGWASPPSTPFPPPPWIFDCRLGFDEFWKVPWGLTHLQQMFQSRICCLNNLHFQSLHINLIQYSKQVMVLSFFVANALGLTLLLFHPLKPRHVVGSEVGLHEWVSIWRGDKAAVKQINSLAFDQTRLWSDEMWTE